MGGTRGHLASRVAHPPRGELRALEASAREEAAVGAEDGGEVDRVCEYERDEEQEELDDGAEKPGPLQPEDALLAPGLSESTKKH